MRSPRRCRRAWPARSTRRPWTGTCPAGPAPAPHRQRRCASRFVSCMRSACVRVHQRGTHAGRCEADMSAFKGRLPDPALHADDDAPHALILRKPVAHTRSLSAPRRRSMTYNSSYALQDQRRQHAQTRLTHARPALHQQAWRKLPARTSAGSWCRRMVECLAAPSALDPCTPMLRCVVWC